MTDTVTTEAKFPSIRRGGNVEQMIKILTDYFGFRQAGDVLMKGDNFQISFSPRLFKFIHWKLNITKKSKLFGKYTVELTCNGKTIQDILDFVERLP